MGKSCTNTAGTDLQTACDSYTWIDGNTYTASNNTATHTLINAAGCDSLVTLDLTINTIDVNVTDSSPTLTANALGATYQWLDCDNGYAAIAGETNQSFLATADGNYAVAVTANNCTDTSACYSVVITGIVENGNTAFASVYPNPTSGILTIDLGNTPLPGGITIELTDMLGRVVIRDQVSVPHIEVDLRKEENGVYVIRIITEAGAHALRVIKQ
ncbi:MAG: T9SS type A sorting domain-containing protein [Bacteroidia bacterium]